jgi:hypothetical protein
MNRHVAAGAPLPGTAPEVPRELAALAERVRRLPQEIRRNLEPAMDFAVEEAVFRGRTLSLARDALARFRHDLERIRFDLEATRRERESLRRELDLLGRLDE